ELLRRAKQEPAASVIDEKAMAGIDMELKDEDTTPAEDFHSDETPNIWALPDEDNAGEDAQPDEDELEKPSFLRRLTGRGSGKKADLEHFGDEAEEPQVL